jgi:amidase
MTRTSIILGAASVLTLAACSAQDTQTMSAGAMATAEKSVVEVSLADTAKALADGKTTSVALTQSYLARIKAVDPKLHSVLAVNPQAVDAAKASDARRAAKQALGPLDGVPILIKDNIDVAGMPNTGGSLALAVNIPAKDAPLVKRLIDGGAVVLGKTNLSEWANIRSRWSSSGWSAVGGLTRNPYALDRSACGSSSGSGSSIAASLAPAAIGTETDGSITCPASINGLVGLKPTVGLVSRSGVIPISHSQDTAGPMTRSVMDAAMVLNLIAGGDAADVATADADTHKTDYVKGLDAGSLKGTRLGVLRFMKDYTPATLAAFDAALEALKAQGAVLVDINEFDMTPISQGRLNVLLTELKVDLNAYLTGANPNVKSRTLADIIAFNKQEPRELKFFGQDFFETAEATAGYDDPAYVTALAQGKKATGPDGIDKMLKDNNVTALVAPSGDPTWLIDLVNGDHYGGSASSIPAIAGYPHLTVPMGLVSGLPVGLSFFGPAWSEQMLLSLGYAYEQATHARKPPTYQATMTLP